MNTDHIIMIAESLEILEQRLADPSVRPGSQLVSVCPTVESLKRLAAEYFIKQAHRAITENGRFSVALSGGSTPRSLYAYLALPEVSRRIHWNAVHLFWGDERCVPPDHTDSNFRMVSETLLEHIPIPQSNIHRIPGELQPAEAAAHYEHDLRNYFGETPRIDLALLGMGEDGHTASLFPGSPALDEMTHWVVDVEHLIPPPPLVSRITLTLPVFNAAHNIVFLVAGLSKAARLAEVLAGSVQPDSLPAQAIHPVQGRLFWMVDQFAAKFLG